MAAFTGPDSPATSGHLHVAVDATPLLGQRTGIGRFTLRLCEQLGRRHDVTASGYAVTWRGRDALVAALPAGVAPIGRALPARAAHKLWQRTDVAAFERWAGATGVVHGTNYVVPPTRRAAQVLSVHDLTMLHHPELCTPHTRTFAAHIRRAIGRGAFVHTDSHFVRSEVLQNFDIAPDRVVTVHLGFDPIGLGDPSAGRALVGSERYIVAVGTIEPRKGYPGLIAAFDRLAANDRRLRLAIVGASGWGADAFAEALRRTPHRDRVVQFDYLDAAEHADVVRGALVLAYPSLYEGFGFPPLEAMSAGIPVVANAAGAVPEVVGDAAILVEVGDDEALAAAIDRAANDPAERAALVRRGAVRTEAYSWSAMAGHLVELYRYASQMKRPS